MPCVWFHIHFVRFSFVDLSEIWKQESCVQYILDIHLEQKSLIRVDKYPIASKFIRNSSGPFRYRFLVRLLCHSLSFRVVTNCYCIFASLFRSHQFHVSHVGVTMILQFQSRSNTAQFIMFGHTAKNICSKWKAFRIKHKLTHIIPSVCTDTRC